jgi:Fic family protein
VNETRGAWPAHEHRVVPWRQQTRGGTIEDRKLNRINVALPPHIADLTPPISSMLAARMETSLRSIAALDAAHGAHLAALGTILLRTESVASSKIEHVDADVTEYSRALHGIKSNASAVSMAAATTALDNLIHSVDGRRRIELDSILRAHAVLMHDDPVEQRYAGKVRDVQNWIGGSDHAPRGADYIPPPEGMVPDYLADLLAFANRDDMSALGQAAISHAQFESIHPFTDGNGRIGRALVNAILRRRGITSSVVVPAASALVAQRDAYFDTLNAYRNGDPEPIIAAFATACAIAAEESRTTAIRIAEFPEQWAEALGKVRAKSAASRLLVRLTEHPVFSAEEAETLIGGAPSAVYAAIERFASAGLIRPLTDRKRNQVWGVADMLDELDDLGTRIAAAAKGIDL